MAFEPQNHLEESLLRAVADPAHRPQFYRDFAESELLVGHFGSSPGEDGAAGPSGARQLSVRNIEFNGKSYIPVFSSMPRTEAAPEKAPGYFQFNALELLRITRGAELLLNPGSDYGKEFLAEEIESILDGSVWEPEPDDDPEPPTALLSQPVNQPRKLQASLARLFAQIPEVERAYSCRIDLPVKRDKPYILIGIVATGYAGGIIAQANVVVEATQAPEPPVEIVLITGQGAADNYFLNSCAPFYERNDAGEPKAAPRGSP